MAITKVYGDQMNEESMGQFNNRPIASACNPGTKSPYSGTVTFDTELVDTHNAFNHLTGIFTCPVAGLYHISFTGFTDVSSGNGALRIRKNGVNITRTYQSSTGSYYNAMAIQIVLNCAVDDTLNIQADVTLHGNDNSQISIIYYGQA